jgi:hypothetical protein
MRCGDGYLFLDNRAALTRALCAGCREASRSHDSLETLFWLAGWLALNVIAVWPLFGKRYLPQFSTVSRSEYV